MVQRKQKISIKPGKSREPLTNTHPHAAGVDIGSSSHYVSVDEIAKSLQGNWRAEHLFALKQALDTWKDITFNYESTDTADFVPSTTASV